jgi:DNA primase
MIEAKRIEVTKPETKIVLELDPIEAKQVAYVLEVGADTLRNTGRRAYAQLGIDVAAKLRKA